MNYVVQAHRTLSMHLIGSTKFSCSSRAKTKTMTTCEKMRLQVLKHYYYSIENSVACTAHGQISDIIAHIRPYSHWLGRFVSVIDDDGWTNAQSFYDKSCSHHESVRIHEFQFVVKCCPLGWHGMASYNSFPYSLATHQVLIFFFSNSLLHLFVLFNYYFIKCVRVGRLREYVSAIFPKSMLWISESKWFIEDTQRYVDPWLHRRMWNRCAMEPSTESDREGRQTVK